MRAFKSASRYLVILIGFLGHISLSATASKAESNNQAGQILFQESFNTNALDSTPENLMIVDGGFVVKGTEQNRFLELPGAPLDTYTALFGPNRKGNVLVSARIWGESKGRRFPVTAVGVGGVGGYRFQIVPGKKSVELRKGESVITNVPVNWVSGKWIRMELELYQVDLEGKNWFLRGKAFVEGAETVPLVELSATLAEAPNSGQASVWGIPYSEAPIRFDDLMVMEVGSREKQ